MPRSWSPTAAAAARQEVLDINRRGEWSEAMRRLGDLRSRFGGPGAGRWAPGQEFRAARRGYAELLGAPRVKDVRGVGDLTAAEAAALIGEEEMIGSQMGDIEEQMRNEMARAGGGGSEWTEMRRELLESGMGAKVKARRGALTTAQMSREAAKQRRQQGLIAGAGGMGGLAGQRQAMTRWGGEMSLQRMQALQNMLGSVGMYQAPSAPVGGPGPMDWQTFGRGFSPATTATELRNQYIWPTQYGQQQYGWW